MPVPGDFVLAHHTGLVPRLIQFGERVQIYGWRYALRYAVGKQRGPDLADFNHAAVVASTDEGGTWIIQATGSGVEWGRLHELEDYVVVDSGLDARGRALAQNFAIRAIAQKYGFVTIASIVVNILTPRIVDFHRPGSFICSALVAQAMFAGGKPLPMNVDLDQVTPAELGRIWKVLP